MRSKSLDLVERVGSDEAALFDCSYRDQQEPKDHPVFRKYTRTVWTSRPMQMRARVRHYCVVSLTMFGVTFIL